MPSPQAETQAPNAVNGFLRRVKNTTWRSVTRTVASGATTAMLLGGMAGATAAADHFYVPDPFAPVASQLHLPNPGGLFHNNGSGGGGGGSQLGTQPGTHTICVNPKGASPNSPDCKETLQTVVSDSNGAATTSLIFNIIFFAAMGGLVWWMVRGTRKQMGQMSKVGKGEAGLVNQKPNTTFDDVIGQPHAKEDLKEVISFLKNPERFRASGVRPKHGVLLTGPPGNGKTLLARAVAGEAGVPFFSISGSEFVEMYVGVGAARVRKLFDAARKAAPCIIFIDEFDAVGRARGAGVGGGNDEREQTLNQILVELDGFNENSNIIVMAATNRPDVLDKAILRPKRFDLQVSIEKPDVKARLETLQYYSRNKKLAADVNLQAIAAATWDFSYAELENVMNEAALMMLRKQEIDPTHSAITQTDLVEGIERAAMGSGKTRALKAEEKNIVAGHESGHAVVGAVLNKLDPENAKPVIRISMVSRGGVGGYVMYGSEDDRFLKTKDGIYHELASALGGRAGEEMMARKPGDITIGAANDLEKANGLARRVVSFAGLSDELGLMTIDDNIPPLYSEKLRAVRDEAVKAMLDASMERSRELLQMFQPFWEELRTTLQSVETIEKPEFDALRDRILSRPDMQDAMDRAAAMIAADPKVAITLRRYREEVRRLAPPDSLGIVA